MKLHFSGTFGIYFGKSIYILTLNLQLFTAFIIKRGWKTQIYSRFILHKQCNSQRETVSKEERKKERKVIPVIEFLSKVAISKTPFL